MKAFGGILLSGCDLVLKAVIEQRQPANGFGKEIEYIIKKTQELEQRRT